MTEKVLVKCTPTYQAFWWILCNCMKDAFGSENQMQKTWQDYVQGRVQLWTIPGRGFTLLSFHEQNGKRFCEFEFGAGKMFYTKDNLHLLKQLAKKCECSEIRAHTENGKIKRLLRMLGFYTVKISGQHTYLKLAV